MLGPYGPEYDKQVWNLTTNEYGEVRVLQPARSRLYVSVQGTPGLAGSWNTVKYYEKQRKFFGMRDEGLDWMDTYYLTPRADVDYEWVRYAYRATSDVVDGKVHSVDGPIMFLVTFYSQAKPHAKGDREKEALREFCRYADLMKAEEAQGWPNLHTDSLRDVGRTFMKDCASASAM
jgi:hypothetical protein